MPVTAQSSDQMKLAAGILALVAGALAMGASVLFVRLADVGPFASAFWRTALALPFLLVWALAEQGRRLPMPDRASILAGLFFAGDLIFWHLAILGTTVANAAVLATTSPIWVALYAFLVLKEKLTWPLASGLLLCVAGTLALIGDSWHFAPEKLAGDAAGLVTAMFFAAYFLSVRVARRSFGAGLVTFLSTAITSVALLIVALIMEPTLMPATLSGAAALLALAIVSQVAGQGLMAVGLSVVPPVFGALVFFLEVVSAAGLGWLVLGEHLGLLQGVGAALIIGGLLLARPRRKAPVVPEAGLP
ncbi:membrane protein [Azorhizobium oxalatiphilum]|uniref:Membrane protein n=1 Tax=Azorhizobium oxalatiphilum TaxID=980631 RepID=A0A917CIM4_9HYPH|nr:DMT family transporter [Azorhizobium oxalatiphilum]GGF87940.1 membrane protein [Azorhizobium oxalatiphilum]